MRDPYFGSKALSKSAIDKVSKSPAYYKIWLDDQEEKKRYPSDLSHSNTGRIERKYK